MYEFLRYKKEISEKAPINKWGESVRMKAVFASLGLVILMLTGAGLTFSVQTDGLIINVEDVPYDPGTRWVYSVGGKGSGAQSRRLTIQLQKSNAGRSDLLESIYFLEGSGIKRLYMRVLSNAVATYSSPEESALIHKIQFPLKLGMEMELPETGRWTKRCKAHSGIQPVDCSKRGYGKTKDYLCTGNSDLRTSRFSSERRRYTDVYIAAHVPNRLSFIQS
jgi:hypothetical protein